MAPGNFIISLDFELHWGVAELWDVKDRRDYFLNTRQSIPQVLSLFQNYGINATWATVGFLFAKDKAQLLEFAPTLRPTYANPELSYYRLMDNGEVGDDEHSDPFHYAPSLISQIVSTPGQELGTHTFSHYYCREKGQDLAQFEADIKAAQALAGENYNCTLQSLVFPRNQFNKDYLAVARDNGIKVVRSNPDVWFWKFQVPGISVARALDTLMPISSSLAFGETRSIDGEPLSLPASRFLRPYVTSEKSIQGIKIRRIKNEMERAAKNKENYHLWWHPHNFGYCTNENMGYLEELLRHFKSLQSKYGFQSRSMIEMYENK